MVDTLRGRQYDEKEFALILRRAAALHDHDRGRPAKRGLSLAEIEAIAAEAGIEPRHIRQAALDLTLSRPAGLWRTFIGPPTHLHAQATLAGEYGPGALMAMLDTAQAELGRPGQARDVLGGVEWIGRDSMGPLQVTARPHAGGTRVEVSTDRRETAAVLLTLLPIGGLLAGGLAAGALGFPAVAAAGAGVAGGVVTARAVWGHVAATWRRRVAEILERVIASADAATSTGPSETTRAG